MLVSVSGLLVLGSTALAFILFAPTLRLPRAFGVYVTGGLVLFGGPFTMIFETSGRRGLWVAVGLGLLALIGWLILLVLWLPVAR